MEEGHYERMQLNEAKPISGDHNSSYYAQSGNDSAIIQRLSNFNYEQVANLDQIEAKKNPYAKEEEFVTLLLTIEGERLSKELFGLLFDLLIANSGNIKDNEGDFFYIFFELLKRGKSDISIQLSLLKELNQYVANYTVLKNHCFRKRWVFRLLQMLPTVEDERITGILVDFDYSTTQTNEITAEFIHLIKSIATMSISTHEMQTIFRMMNSESSTFKPSHLSLLLDVMQLISKRFGPDIYFDFIGPQTGIVLPEFPKGWPGGEGYSFCAWIRIESFEHPSIKHEYRPSLFTLHSPEGSGLEVFFTHKNLVVQIYTNKNKTASKLDYTFQEGQWYFIVLSHTYHFIRRSEFSLYVNGALASSVALNYPKIEKSIKTAIIGNSLAIAVKEKNNAILLQPFYGQMSSFYFFNAPFAKHEDVVSVNLLGPNFNPSVDQDEGKVICGMQSGQFFLDGKRSLKVLFAYNPKAVINNLACLDTSAIESRRIAKLQDGTHAIRTHGIKETLYCIGGIRVLLPMFRTLDQPIMSEILKIDFDAQESAKLDPMFALQVFSLLENMLQNNPQNQEQMVIAHGFQVIGYLLENVNPQCWTKSTIDAIERLSLAIQSCESLFRQLFVNIYLNFRLWIYTSADVQLELFNVISKHVKKQPQYFRMLITVQKLVDTVRTYYWFTAEPCSLATQPIVNPTTFETLGIRPDHATIKKIRVAILQLTRAMTLDEYTFDEIKGFVYYLEDCQDPEQGTDVLQMLLFLLSSKKGSISADTLEYIGQLGGILPFFGVLKRNNANLRVWSLKLIGKILQITTNPKKKERLLGANRLISVKHHLEPFPFVENTYYALLEVLLESVDILSIKNPLHNEEEEFIFKNTSVLSAIFELVCTSGQSVLQQKVLQDFVFLLNQSPSNRTSFLRQLHWQNWLFGILANNPSNQEIFKQVVKILTLLFHHCFHEPNGYTAFSETHSLLSHFGERGFFNHVELLRELNNSVLRSIQYDSKIIQQAKKNSTLWENITKWLSFTEDCLFIITSESAMDNHFLLGIHRRHDGTWLDFEFSQKLLEYLDSLILSHSHPDETVTSQESEEILLRLSLRLTLYTIFETDALLNTDKIRERSSNLKKMETAVEDFFTSVTTSTNPKVKETLAQYLQGKIKHWNGEMNSVDRIFQSNIDRLRNLQRKIIVDQNSPLSTSRILYIVSYLYSAMKRSYERQGIGAELLLSIFKEILIAFRPRIVQYLQVENLPDEKFVEYFMREFSSINDMNPSLLIQFVMKGVRDVMNDEEQYIYKTLDYLSSSKQRMAESIEKHVKIDFNVHNNVELEFNQLLDKHRSEENERLSVLNRQINQTRRIRLKKCKATLNELSHERGPWATPEILAEIPHWKLDKTEDPIRRRFKLKRNRNYKDYSHCAKGNNVYNFENYNSNDNIDLTQVATLSKQLTNVIDNSSGIEEVNESLNEESPVSPDDEEKLLYLIDCDLITPMTVTSGRLEITTQNIYFIVSKENSEKEEVSNNNKLLSKIYQKKQNSCKWPIRNIQALYSRRYLHRQSGLEIQLIDRTMHFINLDSQADRDRVWKKILSLRPPSIDATTSSASLIGSGLPLTGSQLLKKSDLTTKWKNREISNFEYLMSLNTYAGRTYNDLTQYPIFPWVIQDYVSSYLDLNNPATFRDLSKPMGALNPQRLQSFIDRYNSFEDPNIPKFHYGSHYSNAGIVLFYLLRQEPFTSNFLTLQGGKFDHPSRMFMSIPDTWNNCLTNPSDVKELIPEFFYFPEFLENSNNYLFGVNGEYEDRRDVGLPTWAFSARDFIEKNREALESEYVSQHLHEWIDLIFGYKQRGQAAEEAFNVFFYLTYEGVIDIESITDPVERRSIESQIINFGQTPNQLFDKPHPARKTFAEVNRSSKANLIRSPSSPSGLNSSQNSISQFSYDQPECFEIATKLANPIIFLHCYADKLVFITSDGIVGLCSILVGKVDRGLPFSFEVDKTINSKNQRQIDMFFPESMPSISRCFTVSKDGKYLISCGSWDDSIECRLLSTCKKLPEIAEHRNIVTCIALARDGSTLVSGSKDCTVIVWQFDTNENNQNNFGFWARSQKKKKSNGVFRFKRILYGHTDVVNTVDVNVDLDTVVSGSKDQSVIFFSLRKGKFIRSISFPAPVTNVKLNNEGILAVYCELTKMVYSYSINGTQLGKGLSLLEKLLAWSFSFDGKYLITAGIGNHIFFRKVSTMEIVFAIDSNEPICSLRVLSNKEFCFIVCGLKSGKLCIYPYPSILH